MIREVRILRYTECRNYRRVPRLTDRILRIEPPHVDFGILTGTGSELCCGWPQVICRDRRPSRNIRQGTGHAVHRYAFFPIST